MFYQLVVYIQLLRNYLIKSATMHNSTLLLLCTNTMWPYVINITQFRLCNQIHVQSSYHNANFILFF